MKTLEIERYEAPLAVVIALKAEGTILQASNNPQFGGLGNEEVM